MRFRLPAPLLVLAAVPVHLGAQGAPFLVRDIATSAKASTLEGDGPALLVGSTTFFAASTPDAGTELWKTDGTSAGTTLVLDIEPGLESSDPDSFATLSGVLYFAATTSTRGRELWRSDGSVAGTYCVRDIYSGIADSLPLHLTRVNNLVFFSANHPNYGRELWYTDGTLGGTTLAHDVRPGTASSMTTSSEIVWGVRVISGVPFALALFAADDGVHGIELWEASNSGATIRADINPGAANSSPTGFVSQGGHVMFSASNNTTGREPYVTRDSGATLAGDLNPGILGSSPADFAVGSFSGTVKFYFSGLRTSYGRELWEHDTSTGGTTLIEDVFIGSAGSNPVPIVAGTTVLFSAESSTIGRELWKTDGTVRGTFLVKDIASHGSADPSGFFVLSTSPLRVLFSADNGGVGEELWVSDGTTAGTVLVRDILPSGDGTPRLFGSAPGGRALLTAFDAALRSLWYRTDGTNAGTSILMPGGVGSASSNPLGFLGLAPGALTWFAADDGASGYEPWVSNGSDPGTQLLGDLHAGAAASISHFNDSVEFNGLTIFSASSPAFGEELWVSNGTSAGTQLLSDINPGASSSSPNHLTAMNGFVLFFADDSVHGNELWRTDGTSAGTQLVRDIDLGASSSVSSAFDVAARDGKFYFAAETATAGREPWISDGTSAGTVMLKDMHVGAADGLGTPPVWLVTPSYVFFVASDAASGKELRRTDGTTAGTQLVAELSPGAFGSSFYQMVWHAGSVYAIVETTNDEGLYTSTPSGSTAGLVRSFATPPFVKPGIRALIPLGSKLLFAGYTESSGWEPWTSNGTNGGTALLLDIRPGPESGLDTEGYVALLSSRSFFAPPGADVALFSAGEATTGLELWRTNGTVAGTVLHAELYPGPHPSAPKHFAFSGDRIWFSATHPTAGREPFAMEPPAMALNYAFGCPGSGAIVPALTARGTPFLGNRSFELVLDRARPTSAATVNIGFGPSGLLVGGGCTLLVDLLLPYVPLTMPTDSRGEARFALPLPGDPLLEGLDLFAQGFVVDPNGAFGGVLSFTAGWRAILHAP